MPCRASKRNTVVLILGVTYGGLKAGSMAPGLVGDRALSRDKGNYNMLLVWGNGFELCKTDGAGGERSLRQYVRPALIARIEEYDQTNKCR